MDKERSKDGPSKGGRRWWCGLVTQRGPLSTTENLHLCEERVVTLHQANGIKGAASCHCTGLLGALYSTSVTSQGTQRPGPSHRDSLEVGLDSKEAASGEITGTSFLSQQVLVLPDPWERPGLPQESESTPRCWCQPSPGRASSPPQPGLIAIRKGNELREPWASWRPCSGWGRRPSLGLLPGFWRKETLWVSGPGSVPPVAWIIQSVTPCPRSWLMEPIQSPMPAPSCPLPPQA